jgi:hypothetical protein
MFPVPFLTCGGTSSALNVILMLAKCASFSTDQCVDYPHTGNRVSSNPDSMGSARIVVFNGPSASGGALRAFTNFRFLSIA